MNRINLVLSGGGVKGIAHIALLEYFEEQQIEISAISGSSAGALVGAMYAAGHCPKDILQFFRDHSIFKYKLLSLNKGGLFNTDRYIHILKDYLPDTFDSLRIPLHVCVTNMGKGRPEYHSSGVLRKYVSASCAVPGLFSPVSIFGALYTDGGVMDNFPIRPFQNVPANTIGSYVCKPNYKSATELNTVIKVGNHCNALLLHACNQHKFDHISESVIFPLGQYSIFDQKKVDLIYDAAITYLQKNTLFNKKQHTKNAA